MLPTPSKSFSLAATCIAIGLLAWLLWPEREHPASAHTPAPNNPASHETIAIDFDNPAASFDTFRHVLQTGGCVITRPAAIEWLDRQVRVDERLTSAEEAALFTMIADGGHPGWEPAYRQHLFNSAFNALRLGDSGETLARALHRMAAQDADVTLRIYALQHLGLLRRFGKLSGELADEVHASLMEFATVKNGPCAGIAVAILTEWGQGRENDETEAMTRLAARIAADRNRPVDVRVHAMHAAAAEGLAIARTLATDRGEPVILRKAAIARIGHHGNEDDIPTLNDLGGESHRLAAATGPAIQKLRNRLPSPHTPLPVPY